MKVVQNPDERSDGEAVAENGEDCRFPPSQALEKTAQADQAIEPRFAIWK